MFPADVDDVASSACPDGAELSSENLVAEILLNMPPPPLRLQLQLRRETGARRSLANSDCLSYLFRPFTSL